MAQPNSSTRYVPLRDAAHFLGVSPLTIRRRVADGSLPAVRLQTPGSKTHGQLRFLLADLEAMLQPVPASTGDGGRVA